MATLSNISSIATIIAFLILVTGKVILIYSRKDNLISEFAFDYLLEDQWNEIYDEWIIDPGNNYNGDMCIRSSLGLKKLALYQINDEFGNPLPSPILLHEYKNLPANQLLKISIRVPEGYPIYKVTAQRYDYVIFEKEVSYNGAGLQKYNYATGRLTFRSFLFYIFS